MTKIQHSPEKSSTKNTKMVRYAGKSSFSRQQQLIIPPILPFANDSGYQNDDYHGNWSDDPVAPTERIALYGLQRERKSEVYGRGHSVRLLFGLSGLRMALMLNHLIPFRLIFNEWKCNPDNTPQTGQTISIEAKLQKRIRNSHICLQPVTMLTVPE